MERAQIRASFEAAVRATAEVKTLQDLRFFNISTDVQDKPGISTNNTKYHTTISTYLDIIALIGLCAAYGIAASFNAHWLRPKGAYSMDRQSSAGTLCCLASLGAFSAVQARSTSPGGGCGQLHRRTRSRRAVAHFKMRSRGRPSQVRNMGQSTDEW